MEAILSLFITEDLDSKYRAVDAHGHQEGLHLNNVCIKGRFLLVLIHNLEHSKEQWIQKYEDGMAWDRRVELLVT